MASDLDLSCVLTGPSTSIELNGGAYRLIADSVGAGQVSWRRTTAESPWVSGRAVIAAVRETMTASIGVRVTATSASNLASLMDSLVTAFSQWDYTITFSYDGTVYGRWECEPADFSIGDSSGVYNRLHLNQYIQEFYAEVPRSPVTIQGIV